MTVDHDVAAPEPVTLGLSRLRRLALLSLLSIAVALELVLGEVLFAGHVLFLVEALGFAWGFFAFTLLWAVLGLLVIAAGDSLWPSIKSAFERLASRLARLAGGLVLVALALLALAGAVAALALAGDDAWRWASDHPDDVVAFVIAAVAVLVVLLAVAAAGRGLVVWVRRIAETAGPASKSFATLVSMAVLGPALVWPLLRLFRYSRRAEYALTLASAPVFALLWVPFYAVGVSALIDDLF